MNYFLNHHILYIFSEYYGFPIIETRERIRRFNSRLSIYVFSESNVQHHRPHAHILINNQKIGTIFIDTFEIDDSLDKRDKKEINAWLKNNKQQLIDAWERNNGKIDIDFLSY